MSELKKYYILAGLCAFDRFQKNHAQKTCLGFFIQGKSCLCVGFLTKIIQAGKDSLNKKDSEEVTT